MLVERVLPIDGARTVDFDSDAADDALPILEHEEPVPQGQGPS